MKYVNTMLIELLKLVAQEFVSKHLQAFNSVLKLSSKSTTKNDKYKN